MFEGVIVGCPYDCDNVKLRLVANVECCDIGVCGSHHSEYFFIVNGVKRIAGSACACFDFYKNNAIAFHCNYVNLIMADAKISLANCISIYDKFFACFCFAPVAGCVVLSLISLDLFTF